MNCKTSKDFMKALKLCRELVCFLYLFSLKKLIGIHTLKIN